MHQGRQRADELRREELQKARVEKLQKAAAEKLQKAVERTKKSGELYQLPFLEYRTLPKVAKREAATYQTAEPFPHVVLDELFGRAIVRMVAEEVSQMELDALHRSDSKYEVKLSTDDAALFGPWTSKLLYSLNSGPFLAFLERLTGIDGLISDPHLRGGGVHIIRRGRMVQQSGRGELSESPRPGRLPGRGCLTSPQDMPAALHLLVSHRRWLGEPPPRRSDCVSPRRASGPLGLEARSGPARGRVRPRRPAPSPRVPRSLASPCGGLYATCGTQTGGVRPPPPGSRACRAPLRGGAAHEAEGRRGARGSGVGRVGPPPGWHRLRQIGDQLVPGVEQFLLVDDVVAIEDGAALVPLRSMATRSGTFARIRLRAAVRRQSWRKRVGTPAAWQAVRQAVRQRRIVIPSRWKTSGLSGSRRARRRARASAMGCEIGSIRPASVFERAGESRITPPASSISSQVRPRISFLRQPE